jgi:hypothetical protein
VSPSSCADTSYACTSCDDFYGIISYVGTSYNVPSVIVSSVGASFVVPSFDFSRVVSPCVGSTGIRCGGDVRHIADRRMIGVAEV